MAFIAVIMVIVLGHAGYSYLADLQTTRVAAAGKITTAIDRMRKEFIDINERNGSLAGAMSVDPNLTGPLASKDTAAVAALLKSTINKNSLTGFVSVIDRDGKIFYSTDAPKKTGVDVRRTSPGIDYVFTHNDTYRAVSNYSPTGVTSLSAMVPIRQNARVIGVVIVSQPLDTEFLTGMCTKLGLDDLKMANVDMALLGYRDGKLTALTPGLVNPQTAGPFVQQLKTRGLEAVQKTPPDQLAQLYKIPGFSQGGRWWRGLDLVENPKNVADKPSDFIAQLLITTPVEDMNTRMSSIIYLAIATGLTGLVVSLLFTAGITKQVNEPLRYLLDRTNELAEHHTEIPPLEGLDGEWLELGELIDTAVHSMRSSMQSARQQLSRQQADMQDNQRIADDAAQQLDSLNRQFSNQAKQLTEVSKQINSATRQSIFLQHKLDTVMQVSTEGFMLLDPFGNVLTANPPILNWFGATEAEIAGRFCFDIIKRPGEERGDDLKGKALAVQTKDPNELINNFFPEGVIYHRKEDKAVSVLAHLQPILSENANIQGYVMVLRDKSLRSEIALLKNEIVSMLSESIRAPLAMAETQWLTVLNNAPNNMHPSLIYSVQDLHKRHEQLLGVVDSLLMMYGGFVPQQVAAARETIIVTRLVAECLEQASGLARERQLALDYKTITGLPNIFGRRESVKEILVQVLEKMISVTSPGGRVRVESIARGNEMRIGVSSSGPSLPDSEIADMFAGFIEGKHEESTYSTRFAMYLARNNVERLGGKIWAESEAGRGTVIFFILPMS